VKSLDELLGDVEGRRKPDISGFFGSYGLLRNSFPPSRTIIPQVLYDQDEAIQRFVRNIQAVLDESPQRRAMAVLGTTGGGKTHFLRHCQHLFRVYCRDHHRKFAFVEFQAESGSVQSLIRDALDAANHTSALFDEFDLITGIVRKLEIERARISDIKQNDLRNAVQALVESSVPGFVPKDRAGQFDFERLRDVCKKWLDGAVISQTEKKYLGVYSRINTASMAVRVYRELLSLARSLDVIEGVLLCLDEIETLFRGGLRAARIQAFLQDLRYMYDEAVKGTDGYAILVLSASTDEGSVNLRDFSYPVYQRLGFETDSRVSLEPIRGVVDAIRFAYAYIDFAHDEWKKSNGNNKPKYNPRSVLAEAEIEEAYRNAVHSTRSALTGTGAIAQARLLEALYGQVENKREVFAAR
jgi:hypothetical protein